MKQTNYDQVIDQIIIKQTLGTLTDAEHVKLLESIGALGQNTTAIRNVRKTKLVDVHTNEAVIYPSKMDAARAINVTVRTLSNGVKYQRLVRDKYKVIYVA